MTQIQFKKHYILFGFLMIYEVQKLSNSGCNTSSTETFSTDSCQTDFVIFSVSTWWKIQIHMGMQMSMSWGLWFNLPFSIYTTQKRHYNKIFLKITLAFYRIHTNCTECLGKVHKLYISCASLTGQAMCRMPYVLYTVSDFQALLITHTR
jgi:hypothetical protein